MQARALLWVAVAASIVVVGALAALVLLAPRNEPLAPEDVAEARWAPPAALPPRAAEPTQPGAAGLVDAEWVTATAERTGIPERAVAAYAGVAIVKSEISPGCELGWNTIAGIGFAESRHGTHGGSAVQPDGLVVPPIIGIALDGGSTEVVTDTDGGAIDGDTEHDRAVGPMQLIPQTWRNWHVDASGDGIEDPHNLDDAAMVTANYLCRASENLATESGWRAGVAAYNSAPAYITTVAEAAVRYGD